uniref:Uncharacterized protein n=1 Tax=Chromera velia CCMP2878 TaxID=1169474 RepID=A0A0G4FJ47_9ALVE|eukprot:Cvel_17233.t1-p1 / transcript=Cvel_17233.t1 / gene=Cvel_17233 / organism=Chromera_velia_CCMP2878 / gene_product=hypothetical protein / transcript_product=hypothetical protein / location=Cvel_scaffold1363:42773-43333(-) / protein_length=187 / sequence_SO=supercontig / SO=protein_coding / is_pseudo=false
MEVLSIDPTDVRGTDSFNKSKTPSTCLTSASFSSSSSLCATPHQPSFTENAGSLQGLHHDAGPPAACVAPSSSSSGGSGFGSSDAAEPESRSSCTHPSPSASPAAVSAVSEALRSHPQTLHPNQKSQQRGELQGQSPTCGGSGVCTKMYHKKREEVFLKFLFEGVQEKGKETSYQEGEREGAEQEEK